ncbi:unnamed protein product [Linum trigynum]|uniref:Uncharacterized protein n=1 Tax=Linum trigynum TaxID=586398 RepID=A0AAV2GIY6_9ROSI
MRSTPGDARRYHEGRERKQKDTRKLRMKKTRRPRGSFVVASSPTTRPPPNGTKLQGNVLPDARSLVVVSVFDLEVGGESFGRNTTEGEEEADFPARGERKDFENGG